MISKKALNIKGAKNDELDIIVNDKISQGQKIIDLSKGELSTPPPRVFMDNALKAVNSNINGYTNSIGLDDLRQRLSVYASRNYYNHYTKANIAVTAGAKPALYNSLLALVNPGDEVILLTPYWGTFCEQIVLVGASPVLIELKEEDVLISEIVNKISEKTKVIIINTPHNPTGKMLSQGTLSGIINQAIKKDIYVIFDVSYHKLVFNQTSKGSGFCFKGWDSGNVIYIDSFSKSWCITGWRIGYICASEEVINAIRSIQIHTSSNPNCIAQYALLWSIDTLEINEYNKKIITDLLFKKNMVMNTFNSISGVNITQPDAGFFAFVDVVDSPRWAEKKTDIKTICSDILKECSVLVVPGSSFGSKRCFRLSFGGDIEELKIGLDAIKNYISKLFTK